MTRLVAHGEYAADKLPDVTHMRSELTTPSKADLEAYLLQIDANSESPRLAQAQGNAQSATYRVTFEGKWTTTATPGGVPTGAHFSPLSGAVHNSGATFWSAGGTASLGIEAVAELGNTVPVGMRASGGTPLLSIAQGFRLPLEALLDHCGTKRIAEDVHRRSETIQ